MIIQSCKNCKYRSNTMWEEDFETIESFYCKKHKDLFYKVTFCESYQNDSNSYSERTQ